ncbi:hypothetical protein [Paraburkholderia diazotrophica]|uniref:hypothetical protein n=1 Tax=Paraburkholderia diazotrophica TaxID=667676 RepID=UPI00115FC2E1|nr:hypothetical protein [Paraburkholderia diazotrophica]
MNVAGKMARRAQQHLRAAGHLSIIHRYARLRKRSERFDDESGRAVFARSVRLTSLLANASCRRDAMPILVQRAFAAANPIITDFRMNLFKIMRKLIHLSI